jgi:hypothetical protein
MGKPKMTNIALPNSRSSQKARKKIIEAAREYKNGLEDWSGLLSIFFAWSKDDCELERSPLFEEAMNYINKRIDNPAEIESFLAFSEALENLPLVDEIRDPYLLCFTPEEKIDREIVLKLNEFCPELLEGDYYQSNLELPTCAHLSFPSLAHKANDYINDLSDKQMKPNIISPLSRIFSFIEQFAKMDNPYVDNVIAVSFLEDLTGNKKEIWVKLLGSKTRYLLQELERHLESLFKVQK